MLQNTYNTLYCGTVVEIIPWGKQSHIYHTVDIIAADDLVTMKP